MADDGDHASPVLPGLSPSVEQGEHDLHLRDSGVLDIHIDLGDSDQFHAHVSHKQIRKHLLYDELCEDVHQLDQVHPPGVLELQAKEHDRMEHFQCDDGFHGRDAVIRINGDRRLQR